MAWAWILPSLAYVVVVGSMGVTLKFALRSLTWQELLLYTAGAYLLIAIGLVATGVPIRFHGGLDGGLAAVSAFLAPLALIVLFVALDHGDASRVVPLTTAYPFITVVLAALLLGEGFSLKSIIGSALVVLGAIILSL